VKHIGAAIVVLIAAALVVGALIEGVKQWADFLSSGDLGLLILVVAAAAGILWAGMKFFPGGKK
jgi:hypothetical protein